MPERTIQRPHDSIAHKWRDLAERRRAHYVDMYRSGRWKHYYTEDRFLVQMREVIRAAETWAKIAPLPKDARPGAP